MTVSEKLRLVQGLHSHAEIFGFNWDDGSDWTWHDVACKIADEVDVENAKLREQIHWLKQGDILHVLTDQEYIDQCERERLMRVSIDALDKENAKLRELFYEAWAWMGRARYDRSIRDNEMDEIGVKAIKLGFPDYELGIEVDG